MTKRVEKQLGYFKYSGEPVRFRLGTLLVMILAIQFLIVSAFTQLDFNFLTFSKYIPQVPMVFFILGLLDRKYALITVLLYIVLGFCGYPIFAMGGGWRYIFQYGVGYILAYVPAVWISGTVLNRNYNFKNVIKSVLFGLVIINFIGGIVLLFILSLRHESWFITKNLLYSLSSFKFFYDLIFSIIAIYLSLLAKRILWIILS